MAEYIEREALIAAIENDCPELVYYSKREAIDCIKAEPAADVAPVRHGRWIEKCVTGFDKAFCTVFVCAECEKGYRTPNMNYCPNCGARMDLEVSE